MTERLDDPDDFCLTCHGRGGSIERQDPVGDGVGFETFLDPCPNCLGAGKCPWCGSVVDGEYNCSNDNCRWLPEMIGERGDYEPDDWSDYFSDLPF